MRRGAAGCGVDGHGGRRGMWAGRRGARRGGGEYGRLAASGAAGEGAGSTARFGEPEESGRISLEEKTTRGWAAQQPRKRGRFASRRIS